MSSSSSCRRLRQLLSRPRWAPVYPPRASPPPTASTTPPSRATGTMRWLPPSPAPWPHCSRVPPQRVGLVGYLTFDWDVFRTLNRSFFSTALAPSSTFAPSVSVASPAKLQAAATLAEVANGIEGEVSRGFITERPVDNSDRNYTWNCVVSYRSKTLNQPQ